MKKTCVVMLMVLLFASMALGQTAISDVQSSQDQVVGVGGTMVNDSQVQGGQGGSSSSGSTAFLNYQPTYNSTYPEGHIQLPNPQIPGGPWWQPNENQISFWNDFSSHPSEYEREWTMEEVDNILKDAGWDTGFTWSRSFFEKCEPTSKITTRISQMLVKRESLPPEGKMVKDTFIGIPFDQIPNKLKIGGVSIRGSENKTKDAVLAKGLKVAMLNGGRYAIITVHGMNTRYKGQSISPGGGAGGAGVQNSFSLIGGATFTKSGGVGEPTIRLSVFKAGESEKPGAGSSPQQGVQDKDARKKEKERDEIEGKKINPGILKSGAEEKPKLWYWGIGTTPETERRAQMSQSDILRMSPSFK